MKRGFTAIKKSVLTNPAMSRGTAEGGGLPASGRIHPPQTGESPSEARTNHLVDKRTIEEKTASTVPSVYVISDQFRGTH